MRNFCHCVWRAAAALPSCFVQHCTMLEAAGSLWPQGHRENKDPPGAGVTAPPASVSESSDATDEAAECRVTDCFTPAQPPVLPAAKVFLNQAPALPAAFGDAAGVLVACCGGRPA